MNWHQEKIKKHPQCTNTQLVSDVDILYPPFALAILKIFAKAREAGLGICIYETYRAQERQLELFDKGKTKLKSNGMHHFGVATDIVFFNDKKWPSWDATHPWSRLGEFGKSLGLYWGGDWEDFRDLPHFQLIKATSAEQAKIVNGEYPAYDSQIDSYLEQLIPAYNKVKSSNYSDPSMQDFLLVFKKIESPKIIESEPTSTEKAEHISDLPKENKRPETSILSVILAWCTEQIKKLRKPK